MDTYEDTLVGNGYIANWPGMHPHGSRIIRDSATGEIVDVLPPAAIEQTKAAAEEAAKAEAAKEQAPPESEAQA